MQWYQYIHACEIWWYLINTHVVWWLWNRNWLAHCPSTCLLLCWPAVHDHNACTSPSGVCYSPSGVCFSGTRDVFEPLLCVSQFWLLLCAIKWNQKLWHVSELWYELSSDMYLNSDMFWIIKEGCYHAITETVSIICYICLGFSSLSSDSYKSLNFSQILLSSLILLQSFLLYPPRWGRAVAAALSLAHHFAYCIHLID